MHAMIAGLRLQNHLMNAAYIGSKTTKDIKELIDSDCGAVVVGSITVQARRKNPGQNYWRHKDGFYSLNSYGMLNGGLVYFKKELPKIVELAHAKHKPVIANVAGFSKEEFVELIRLAQTSGVDLVELNLGCPNVWKKNQQKSILSYNPILVEELLSYIRDFGLNTKIAVKISPLPPDILREIAQVITNSKMVDVVVATNSYPNASVSAGTSIENEEDIAGMTGRALKPISLGVVKQLHDLLPSNIGIIGCGGISSINDVKDYLSAGANAVQIATALVEQGPKVFSTLVEAK